jgi:hypothetical protein
MLQICCKQAEGWPTNPPVQHVRQRPNLWGVAIAYFKGQKLNVHLNVMAWDLFVVAFRVNLPQPCAAWQPIHAIPFEHPGDCRVRYPDAVIARQIPDDPHGTEVIFAAQVKNLLFNLYWRPVRVPLRDRWSIDQAIFAMLPVGITPSIKTASSNPEVPAGFGDMPCLFSMP